VVYLGDDLVEVQGTAEKATFGRSRLNELLDAADAGIAEIFASQRRVLEINVS